ncbi:hypothetical protein ABG79_00978 [Caloramator mitchellensis]|uniref:Uncharacterized protein n=1 Tax=Caloramator mitchellensis TaxID=908809 RepID=A0A0R3K1Q0_CALMK|nr:hypothetical protein [Caloramator mitchellensis]KRQ87180.1 hypothetical protein ABG79_00978 [Caloramator mitchellensis]
MSEISKAPKKALTKFIISFFTVIIVIIVSFLSYYYFTNRINFTYLSNIKKIYSQINDENKNVSSSLNKVSFISIKEQENITNIINDIKKSEQSFNEIINNVEQISPPEKYISEHKTVLEAIRNNKKIVTQARLILSNLKSKNIPNAISDFNKYINDTNILYSNLKTAKISLPDDFSKFPDTLQTFAYKYFENYDKKNRLFEQYQDYFVSTDAIISQFINTKVNLSIYLDKMKNNHMSIENINAEIEKRLIFLEDIKNTYLEVAAPEKVVDAHSKLDAILEGFELYCKDFKSNLLELSNAGSDEAKLLQISQKFEELEKSYNLLTEDWMRFLDEYNNLKDEFSDINNI